MSSLPVVAIVGRPNVGKSTLLNRLCGGRQAIVADEAGVTRDRLYREAEWTGYRFWVVDTGGVLFNEDTKYLPQIREQVELALAEAQVAILVVDGRDGTTAADQEIASWLRGRKLKVLIVVNKLEEPSTALGLAAEFWNLGLGEPYAISAMHGSGTGDILDAIVADFHPQTEFEEEQHPCIALVGRPNVGKSSLLNRLVGKKRSIVAAEAGTTRDAIDTLVNWEGKTYKFVDTAGIRRRARVDYGVESFGVVRSFQAMRRSDVVVLMLDATEGLSEQEMRLAGKVREEGRACILAVNKWDLVEKNEHTLLSYTEKLREDLYYLEWAPIIFISALTGQRVSKLYPLVDEAVTQHRRRVTTAVLNEVLKEATLRHSPPASRQGRQGRIYYGTQVSTRPPTFCLFVNDPKLFKDNYRKYIEEQFRGALGFSGTPLRLLWRGKTEREIERQGRQRVRVAVTAKS
ncbi:ribosome biogenesis GTPase Der [Candidatus Cyanaurora vandensis]|uniref:ribosome biogenesis GTPase Der n=1 Tax=Candidatus Cyanaurora vandensis TaxID=2714958 RepID=UPI00257FAB79|nr:ribosome biogenesis GTPase Der [Candidatus Cyanaurora vandensis]